MRTEAIVVVAASLVLCAAFAKLAPHIKHAHPVLALLAVFGSLVPGVLAIVTDLFLFRLYLRRARRKQESLSPLAPELANPVPKQNLPDHRRTTLAF